MNLRPQSTPEKRPAPRTQAVGRCLLTISIALLAVFSVVQVARAQKAGPHEIVVNAADIQTLSGKLQQFDTQLSAPELGAMNLLLWRAAKAPLDDPAGNNIRASFFDIRGPGTLADENGDRGGGGPGRPPGQGRISIAGGILAQDRENRPPPPPPPPEGLSSLRAALGVGAVSAGPKHDDPAPPPPETINALANKLQAFGGTLSPAERGTMDWLLQRAATNNGPSTGTPGGQPPGLAEALGIAPFGSRASSQGGNTWVLRFAQ